MNPAGATSLPFNSSLPSLTFCCSVISAAIRRAIAVHHKKEDSKRLQSALMHNDAIWRVFCTLHSKSILPPKKQKKPPFLVLG